MARWSGHLTAKDPHAPSPPLVQRRSPARSSPPASPSAPSWQPSRSPRAPCSRARAAGQADGFKKAYVAQAKNTRAEGAGLRHVYLADGTHIHPNGLVDDGHGHNHNDPATKNAVSRAALTTDARDRRPDDARSRRAGGRRRGRSSAQQSEPDALQRPGRPRPRPPSPTNRYNMFNACYGLQSAKTGRWLTDDNVPTFAAASESAGAPFYFKPTALGRYLLYSAGPPLPRRRPGHGAVRRRRPARSNDWVVQMPKSGQFTLPDPRQGLPHRRRLQRRPSPARPRSCGCTSAPAARSSPRSAPTSRATRSPA